MLKDLFKFDWQFYLLLLLAALIPFEINLRPIFFIWILLWVYSGEYKKFNLPKFGWFWIFCSFFILHLIGCLYSKNKETAVYFTEEKMGFLIFPVLLTTYSLKKDKFKAVLTVYCFSCITVAAYLIMRSVFFVVVLQYPFLTYMDFTSILAPSSISLYMLFSMSILYVGDIHLSKIPRNDWFIKLALSFILVLTVLLCSSKIGFIALALTVLSLCVYFIIRLKAFYYMLLFLVIISGTCFLYAQECKIPLQRLNNIMIDYNSTKGMNYYDLQEFTKETAAKSLNQRESILARILIWDAAIPVIKQHLLFGVGTGDVCEARYDYSKSQGLDVVPANYNLHNQYIETQMGLGLPGLLILLLLTVGAFIYSIIKKDMLMGIFSMLFILNFCVESMLIGYYLPVFFSLFLYLFIKKNISEKQLSQQIQESD